MNLKHLSDSILLSDTKRLVARENEISFEVLLHFKEIERRRLHSELGYSSLFDYATTELGYSASSAMRTINASRLLEDLPEIAKRIENGVLNLTNLSNAAQLFKNEDISDKAARLEVLAQIENTSTRECEKVLMTYSSPLSPPPEKIKRVSADLFTIKLKTERA